MNTILSAEYWFLDLVLLLLFLVLGYIVYRLEFHRVLKNAPVNFDESADDVSGNKFKLYPERLIRQCGMLPGEVQVHYWASKIVLGMLFPLFGLELGLSHSAMLAWFTLSLVGFFMPDLWLLRRRSKRRSEITNSLGFFISLMVVYMRTGMTMAVAFKEASIHGLAEGNALVEEVELISREIEAGRDSSTAFRMLAKRTGVPAVKRLAAIINVGADSGSSTVDTLMGQAEILRVRQGQLAAEMVSRKSMEAMLPMMLIAFPVFLVLVMLPAALQLFDVLRMIGELL